MIVTGNQTVAIHTHSGVMIHQFLPSTMTSVLWSRALKDISRCEMSAPHNPDDNLISDITPWLHWMSVWDGDNDDLLWTGPIQKVTANRTTLNITARDVAILTGRTRIPITKRWDNIDPCVIATELWKAMVEGHNLSVKPITRADPLGDSFDHDIKADTGMVDSVINDLVDKGFKWTVAAGVPILGPMPYEPFTSLSEADFLGDAMEVTRDGSMTYNDVLLRAADTLSRARIEMGGLNLQTIVNVDSMFGVSNADSAVKQYAKHVAGIRTDISLPSGAVLHPNAPISVEQLVPGARIVAEIHALRVLSQITAVEVECGSGVVTPKITLESVNDDLPELAKPQNPSTGGNQNAR